MNPDRVRYALYIFLLGLVLAIPATAQTVAILTPDKAKTSLGFAEKLTRQLGKTLKVLDGSLAEAAYVSTAPTAPFNLRTVESRRIAAVIGCDFFVVLRSAVQRRSAFQRTDYYEAYSTIYVVSGRTGRLVLWRLPRFENTSEGKAAQVLLESVPSIATEIENSINAARTRELNEIDPPAIEEVPDANSAAAKNFRPPVPFRRVKPSYTTEAALYDIEATVDVLVDTDANGTILGIEVVRWAGFGLEESVEKTVRAMNWRPAERNGKTLPMRFLVRYNFKKIEKD